MFQVKRIENGVEVKGWTFTFAKSHIFTSDELDVLKESLDAPCLPEMVFGRNRLCLHHQESGTSFVFDASHALKEWDFRTPANIKVAYSKEWSQERSDENKDMVAKDYDWTFTTPYKGHLEVNGARVDEEKEGEKEGQEGTGSMVGQATRSDTLTIDMERLKRPDPILFYEDIILFHDELADNGDAVLSVKCRAMPTCLFVLLRFWMRLDDVLFRVIDTRLYHEFGKDYVVREQKVMERSEERRVGKECRSRWSPYH
eukprot:TRINITY_DN4706_c0_g1_i2.p1 TRINITY_DN4706_c0_g1~~TRINITY_DN4706_c0_g1_i2.p1  ORF type:complete len:257 (-),score=66.51 TRINITY_DN4706_c0_g1_i2:51-821(-)